MQNAPRYALHVQVRYCGTLVEDRVFPRRDAPLLLGGEGDLLLPPPHNAAHLAEVRWSGPGRVEIVDAEGGGCALAPGEEATLQGGDVELELALVQQFRHPRPPMLGEGDLVLAVSILAMTVLGLQIAVLLSVLQPPGGDGAAATPEPSPELIARLLMEDLDGAERGMLAEPMERPEAEKKIDSFFLPAGNKGPMEALGGAARTAPEPVRTPNTEAEEQPTFQPLPPQPEAPAVSDAPDALRIEGVSEPQSFAPNEDAQDEESEPEEVAAEEETGWGLYDWYDAEDARRDLDEIRDEIRMARQMLAIDPESSWALQQLGYYQYLAQDYDNCEKTYKRFVELYPDSAAGYNNLALVYKRTGEYAKEEGYYRLALALDPDDDHALNNLAVNLAHQGRFSEAISIMDELAVLIPGDAYADLHRAKIYAARGDEDVALDYLERSLEGMAALDTLHHIEFRQDIRVDPVFDALRTRARFNELLLRYYGEDAEALQRGHSG